MKNIIITDKDNNAEFQLSVGDKLTIRLKSVPGTGYSWSISGETRDVLNQIGEPNFEKADARKIGGTVHQTFHYLVQNIGKLHLKLEYRRPWEKKRAAVKSFSTTLLVKE